MGNRRNNRRVEEITQTPCIQCGVCCLTITCALGQAIFLIHEDDVCPAIEIENGLYYCGLIANTKEYIERLVGSEQWKLKFICGLFIKLIGIGEGCTNGEKTGEEHQLNRTMLDFAREIAENKVGDS